MSEPGHNSIAGNQLRAFVERIQRVEDEIKSLNDDKRDIYAEAKGTGFDTKIIKKIIAMLRRDHAERKEEEAIMELYLEALGLS